MTTRDDMRADVAAALGVAPQDLRDDTDLLHAGLDSISVMKLAASWGTVTFAELIEHRTLAAWHDLVADRGAAPASAPPELAEVDASAPFPLATMQHAYWVGRTDGQVLGGVGAHFYAEFDGEGVDAVRLDRAVGALVDRHPMLSCRFLPDGTQQIVPHTDRAPVTVRDLRDHDPERAGAELDDVRHALAHARLDVARGEVFDVSLSLRPGGATRVHVKIEMLVADAQSFRVLMADLAALYAGTDLPELTCTYPAYLATHAAARAAEEEPARAYWRERLPELPTGPDLPLAGPPERITEPTVERRHLRLSAAEWARLAGHARAHGVTLSMVFLTAFAEVLAAWSTQHRFLLNLPLYDRTPYHPDVPDLVGDFTGLLLLDADLRGEAGFAARARALHERFAQDVRHTAYSGVAVLRDLARQAPDGAAAAPVVFTSALSLGELFGPEVRTCFGAPGYSTSQTPQVWLDCQVVEREGGLFVNWDVVRGLFADGVLDGMFAAFGRLVRWLTESEDWDGAPAAGPVRRVAAETGPVPGGALHEGFFAWADKRPGDVALVGGPDGPVSYGELSARALTWAGWLRERGVHRGDLVGVCLPKGVEQVAAVLGVLAAGGAYVPVGVDQPVARRERIFERAGVRCVIGGDAVPDEAAPLDEPVTLGGDRLAYVIFTSGSTGEPKGVMVPHRAALNTIEDIRDRFAITGADRAMAVSAPDFDLSVFDLFGLLGAGGSLCLVAEDERRDAEAWVRAVREHGVTVWQSAPALLDMLLTAGDGTPGLPGLRLALLGGDWVGLDLRDRLVRLAPGARLIALGGTTETAIHSSHFEVGEVPPEWRSIPYGRALRNQRFRVVDERGRDCPDWVAGELWIGGASVADGYIGDPGLTAEKFVTWDGERWYRTGDLGRFWPDGTLEFLGRADFQVKIRGHRIELGEIEAALAEHPDIAQAVALTLGQRLAAAVIPAGGGEPSGLEEYLRDRLPSYMVPDRTVALDAFPLTGNGKIDRRALRTRVEAAAGDDAARPGEPPRGAVETALAELWRDLLGVATVHRDDGFFALGGDSLLATRLLGRMRTAGLRGGDLRALFDRPRLRDFAGGITYGTPVADGPALVPDIEHRHDPFPPTEVQRAYWMGRSAEFTLGSVGSHWYWEFDGAGIDLPKLEAAWNALIRRHEMLRAHFTADGEQRIQAEVPYVPIPVTGETPDELRERLSHRVPDPTRWPLVLIEATRYDTDRTRVAFSFDYIVLDALSIVTVFAELARLYREPDAVLPPIGVSFRDYVLGAPAEDPDDRRYWLDRLDTLPPAPRLPLRVDPDRIERPRFVRREHRLAPEAWRALRDRARDHGLTPATVLATAFAEVLAAWSDRTDLTLNFTLFDRREVHPDIDRVLGDFTSLLLVPYAPDAGAGWPDRARHLQEQVWSGMEHGSVSALSVLRELARRAGPEAAAAPVVFTSSLGLSGELADLTLPFGELIWGISQTPQVWLDCQVVERAGGLSVNWDVVEDLFPDGVLDAMFGAFRDLLDRLAGPWDTGLAALTPGGQLAVREATLSTGAVPPGLLHDGFFGWVAKRPDDVALAGGPDGPVSYGDLSARALTWAGWLRERGVHRGDLVGVCLPKGVEQVAAVLGVLAAGGAYVPVGVDQPVARRERIFERAGVRCVIDGSVAPDDAAPLPEPVAVDPDATAYVIFTSGSTGEPKGVMMSHRAALNTIEDIRDRFAVTDADRVLAVSALDFDLSVFDVFGLLGVGGSLCLVAEDERRDPDAWARAVREHRVTLWNTVPALLDMLLLTADDLDGLRLAMVSGDWVGLDLRDRLVERAPGARLISLGGATEAGIWSNFHEVREVPPEWRSIPYGRALRNQRFRVVDERGRDCPDWVAGELWIGGASVADGYIGDAELTGRKFVTLDGERWYRTGDLGRFWPDGTLEFLGRADFQVKIRGHRIELGEIEAALAEHPGVAQAVALTVGQRLGAAVIARPGADLSGLDGHLRDRLPAYMVPDRVLALDAFPLTGNGKIDRTALAGRLGDGEDDAADEPPRDGLEADLAALWGEYLGAPVPGRDRGFFELGGDSLLAVRLVTRVRERYRAELALRDLLAAPALADFAATVAARLDRTEEEGEL